ncbi:MAG: beta-galactosidase [Tepidisphaeraceae bacterium]
MTSSTMHKPASIVAPVVRGSVVSGWAAIVIILLARGSAAAEPIRLSAVAIEPAQSRVNLLANPGFEATKPDGIPVGWNWDRRNTDATCEVDRTQSHRGRQCLRLTNGTAFGAHVYGMLWIDRPIRLVEGKPYTMSAWVKSEKPGVISLIGGADWQFRAQASSTDGRWHRIHKTFTPAARDCDFTLRIGTESITPGVWIDDVKLEEGTVPTVDPAVESDKAGVFLEAEEAETVVQGDGPFGVAFTLSSPRAIAGIVTAALSTGETLRQAVNVGAGIWRVRIKGEAASADDAQRTLSLRLEQDGKEAAATTAPVRFFSANNALLRLTGLRKLMPALKGNLGLVKSSGQDISYPTVTATVLEDFLGYAEEDARRGEVRRSLEQVGDMERMAAQLRGELKEALAGQRRFPDVPRWTGEQRPVIKGSSFISTARIPGMASVERPVFFTGYGHFGQVVADMEKWPGYGTNIIQIELGPNRIFPGEGRSDDAPAREMLQILNRAQCSGVAVCLLISPHYFPDWALKKWPHLRKHREGFLQFCLHAPEGRDLLRRFIIATLAPLKDHPALHSICLTNEPVNEEEPCEPATNAWHMWLEKHHGNIATVNARYGSSFPAFDAVPLPDPFGKRPARPVWMDYIRFNQEFFADWHRMLADAVHEVAPALPVHAKAMTWTLLNDTDVKYGVDATLFGRFSQINGNDSVNMFDFGDAEFAQGWETNAMSHDLQRSVLDAPVFNAENHLITDRDTRYVPAAHVRAALWQAAVHGQSATTIWVWERTFDPRSDVAGSIMHRPACAQAVGVVNCDLNRAALEMTAIQQARPQALLLQSVSASVWDGGNYSNCVQTLYTALSFTGLTLGFVTERQLESGVIPDAPVIFVPGVVHLSQAALAGLKKFKGRVVLVGGPEVLTQDEYGHAGLPRMEAEAIPFRHVATSARDLREQILSRLSAWNLRPAVEVRGADGRPVWGVEWRSAETLEGAVVNLCNYRKQPATVALFRAGRPVAARDVLSGTTVEGVFNLGSLEVRLLRLDGETKAKD